MQMERMTKKPSRPGLLVLVLGIGFFFTGCSGDDVNPFSSSFGKKKRVEKSATKNEVPDDPDLDDDDDTNGKITKSIDNSGAAFQAKDVGLLRSSIGSCFGADKLQITAEMLLPPTLEVSSTESPDGKIKFLLPSQYVAGDDIVEKEKKNMVDLAQGNRTGIASDSLTDTYLRSLETVANVVSHHCNGDLEECRCGSKDDARIMLTRCLPGLDPNTIEMDEAAEMLGLVCVEGPKGLRKAIASMLSSYSFASAR